MWSSTVRRARRVEVDAGPALTNYHALWHRYTQKGGDMRRHFRRAFNFAPAVSAVLCVLACGLWLVTYHDDEWYCWYKVDPASRTVSGCQFMSNAGKIHCWLLYAPDMPLGAYLWFSAGKLRGFERIPGYGLSDSSLTRSELCGLFFRYRFQGVNQLEVIIPHWLAVAVFALLPLANLAKATHRLIPKNRPGLCRICGYDLRATPARCPECGAVPATD